MSPWVDPSHQGPESPAPKGKRRWLRWTVLLLAIFSAAGVGGLGLWLERGLPATAAVVHASLPEASWIVAPDHQVLGELYQERRRSVPPAQLNASVRTAFIAAHDPNWTTRPALGASDCMAALLRAAPRADGHPGGLSVPLASMALPSSRGRLNRVRAWLLARQLERDLQKEELLALYLNRVDLGEGGFGVEEAALWFFSKRAAELDLAEAALLASLPPAPYARAPRADAGAARKRRDQVLDAIGSSGLLGRVAVDEAKKQSLLLRRFHPQPGALVQSVRLTLRKALGRQRLGREGLTVQVSEDPALQLRAERAVRDAALHADELVGWRGTVTSMDLGLYERLRALLLGGEPGLIDLREALPVLATADVARIARASRVRPVVPDEVLLGVVTAVSASSADVQVGSAVARLRVEEASWAFNNLSGPHDLTRLLHLGDVVWTRVVGPTVTPGGVLAGKLEQRGTVDGAAVVVESQTGRVVALVGGMDGRASQFDRARQLARPVGAGLSPLVYGLAVEKTGLVASTLLQRPPGGGASLWEGDVPGTENGASQNPITAFQAFVIHDAAAHAAAQARLNPEVLRLALAELGFGPPDPNSGLRGPVGSPWALVRSWTALASDGTTKPLHLIDQVTGSSGQVVWTPPAETVTVLEPSTANLMRQWQAAASQGPFHQVIASHIGHEGWCAGQAGSWAVAIWVGPDRPGLRNPRVLGSGAPCQAFAAIANDQREGRLSHGNVIRAAIDPKTGLLSRASDALLAPFIPGTQPTRFAKPPAPPRHRRPSHADARRK